VCFAAVPKLNFGVARVQYLPPPRDPQDMEQNRADGKKLFVGLGRGSADFVR
jgi:hypothetical protein